MRTMTPTPPKPRTIMHKPKRLPERNSRNVRPNPTRHPPVTQHPSTIHHATNQITTVIQQAHIVIDARLPDRKCIPTRYVPMTVPPFVPQQVPARLPIVESKVSLLTVHVLPQARARQKTQHRIVLGLQMIQKRQLRPRTHDATPSPLPSPLDSNCARFTRTMQSSHTRIVRVRSSTIGQRHTKH